MTPRGRRLLLFVAMVAAGLAVVVLLSDPFERRTRAVIHDLPADADAAERVRVVDGGKGGDTLVSFPGELEFDVLQPVEVAPGKLEERPAWRVHMMSGQPDPAGGGFLASRPRVRMLDRDTGAETATLQADEARFETGSSVGGTVAIDFSHMTAQRFSLTGHVRGDFPMADGDNATLLAERLDVNGRVATAPGPVTWSRADMTLTGNDMTWTGDEGHVEFRADAHLSLSPSAQRKGLELDGPGGLSWTVPPDASDPRHAGFGELRGPVTGRTADGSTLASDRLVVDGAGRTLTLVGPSTLGLGDATAPLTVVSNGIRVDDVDGEPRVSTDQPVQWSRPGMAGHGTGLLWDSRTGHLHFDRDVKVEFAAVPADTAAGGKPAGLADAHGTAADRAPFTLDADGGLDWTVPPGAADPLREGTGEARGNVRGGDGTASFRTELLRVDGQAGTVALVGPSTWGHATDRDEVQVRAGGGIAVRTAPDGAAERVAADGGAEAWLRRQGEAEPSTHLRGQSLVLDRPARELTALGNARIERAGDPPLAVTAGERLLVTTDEQDEPRRVQADGGVACVSGEYEARGASLDWDLVADRAVLSGDCRLLSSGAWMSADRVELCPRAETFRILRSTLHVRP